MTSIRRKSRDVIETCRNDGVLSGIYSFSKNTVPYYHYLARQSDVYNSATPTHPLEPVYISPDDIVAHSPIRFPRSKVGSVEDGSWDILSDSKNYPDWCLAEFDSHPLYEAMEQRYKNGLDWSETEWIEMVKEEIDEHGKGWYGHCKSEREIVDRCDEVDRLYESIKNEGYQFGSESHALNIPKRFQEYIFGKAYHEITINIGRDGTIYFNGDGRHRLFLTKLIRLEEVPVLIVVRHSDWQKKGKKCLFTVNR